MRRVPLLWVAAFAALGIGWVDSGRFGLAAGVAVAIVAAALLLMKRNPGLARIGAGALLALVLAGFWHHLRLAEIRAFPLAAMMERGVPVAVVGEAWVDGTVETGERSTTTGLRITTLELGGRQVACAHSVPCWIQKRVAGLAPGSRVRFTGTLLPLEGPVVPGGFDAREFFYRSRGSLAKLEVRDGDRIEILPGRSGNPFLHGVRRLRTHLEAALLRGVPAAREPYARLVAAMALGAKENSPDDLEEFFRTSGTMHLFAVSGLHVGIVAGILIGLFRALRIPKTRAVPAILVLIAFYAVLTGLSPSAVRASVMAAVMLAAFALREQGSLLNSLGFAALFLLAWDTQQLFLPGFQLSFVVLFFIACFAKSWSERIGEPFLSDPFLPRRLIRPVRRGADHAARFFAAALAVSLASWLGSAGLLSWHFQSVAPVGIVANLLMVPFASWIISLAALSLAASFLQLGFLAVWVNRLNAGVALVLTTLAQWFAALPGATVHTGAPGREVPAPLSVTVMGDRGDSAILLSMAEKPEAPRHWMIDTGSQRTYQRQVLPLMRSRGLNRIDALVLTHGDQGHIGGAVPLMQQFRPALLVESGLENRSPTYPDILATAATLGMRTVTVGRGSLLETGGGARLQVLHPDPEKPGRLADDRALVLRLEFGPFSLLLSADSSFEVEKSLVERGTRLSADGWIRGQSDEGGSGLESFTAAIAPRFVVSSHAEFPASERVPEALRRQLASRGIPLYEVGEAGPVELRWEGTELEVRALGGGGRSLGRFPTRAGP